MKSTNTLIRELCQRHLVGLETDHDWVVAQRNLLEEAVCSNEIGCEEPRRFASLILKLKRTLRDGYGQILYTEVISSVATTILVEHPQVAWWLVTLVGETASREERLQIIKNALSYCDGVGWNFKKWQFAYRVLLNEEAPAFEAKLWWPYLIEELKDGYFEEWFTEVVENLNLSPADLFQLMRQHSQHFQWPGILTSLIVFDRLDEEGLKQIRERFSEQDGEILISWLRERFYENLYDLEDEIRPNLATADMDQLREWHQKLESGLPEARVANMIKLLPCPADSVVELFWKITNLIEDGHDPTIRSDGEPDRQQIERLEGILSPEDE